MEVCPRRESGLDRDGPRPGPGHPRSQTIRHRTTPPRSPRRQPRCALNSVPSALSPSSVPPSARNPTSTLQSSIRYRLPTPPEPYDTPVAPSPTNRALPSSELTQCCRTDGHQSAQTTPEGGDTARAEALSGPGPWTWVLGHLSYLGSSAASAPPSASPLATQS